MQKKLFDFIQSCSRLADLRNVGKNSPVVLKMSKPVLPGDLTVVCSVEEPNSLYFPLNIIWICLDGPNSLYLKCLKLVSTVDTPPLLNTWEEITTYESLDYIITPEWLNLAVGPAGPQGPIGPAGESTESSFQPLSWRESVGEFHLLQSDDSGKALAISSNGGEPNTMQLLVGTDAAMPMPIGSVVILFVEEYPMIGVPSLSVVAQLGVTLMYSAGYLPSLRAEGSIAKLTKRAANTWTLDGDLTKPAELVFSAVQRRKYLDFTIGTEKEWSSFIPEESVYNENFFLYVAGTLMYETQHYLLNWSTLGKPLIRIISYDAMGDDVTLVYFNNVTRPRSIVQENIILLEDGTPMLLEDGTFILLEDN
jgi:hypothetical protein